MRSNDVLLLKYAKKVDKTENAITDGTLTFTEKQVEGTDTDKDPRRVLGTQTLTNTSREDTDADRHPRFTNGTQTVTKTLEESTDSDR